MVKIEKRETEEEMHHNGSSKHDSKSSSNKNHHHLSSKRGRSSSSEHESESNARRHSEVKPVSNSHHQRSSRHSDSEEDVKIHKKPVNGFSRSHSNTAEEEKHHRTLKDLATDVKSKEAIESGAFDKFDLPKNIIEKLKAKGIQYLYPIQVATLKHIRAGHDLIAQASKMVFISKITFFNVVLTISVLFI